jgi:EAL domain-containing protein (putative c-di-GMP-specific phosphodiesterase class I)
LELFLFVMDVIEKVALVAVILFLLQNKLRSFIRSGKNEQSMPTDSKQVLRRSLEQALTRKELSLKFQPQFQTDSCKLHGFEALLRWENPTLGNVSPLEFIRVAEETGLIHPIGEWVLRQACIMNREIQKHGFPESRISVNISPIQLEDEMFSEKVLRVLEETGHSPLYLELEITESTWIDSLDIGIAHLNRLRSAGIRISLDDFGTGYSSLSYLSQLPFHVIKIDKSFIQKVGKEKSGSMMVSSIISMLHQLDLSVVAEGIETEEQLQFLRSCGCECVQGFLLGIPLDGKDTMSLVRSGQLLNIPCTDRSIFTQ